jgi:exodeoxyribonuclease V beta subunit
MSARRAKPRVLVEVPREGHVVIEASAGTGKTFTIESLVVDFVLERGIRLDEILVVTFTERATAELRMRVRQKLEALLADEDDPSLSIEGDAWTMDDGARARIRDALHAFDGASISTIHAFCHRILGENAFAHGRLFDETQVDARDVFARAFTEALRSTVAGSERTSRTLAAAIAEGWSLRRIEALLFAAMRARAELRPKVDAGAIEAALDAFPLDVAIDPAMQELLRRTMPKNRIAAALRGLDALASLVDRWRRRRDVALFVAGAEELDKLRDRLDTADARSPALARLRAAVAEVARVTPTLEALLVHELLPPVRDALARRKREMGLFDFDDMLALVDDALAGPHGDTLRRTLRARFKVALIDEFQDTDDVQWSIFRRLFFESDGACRLVLVGDPKQAIYRFRGADVHTYLRARREVTGAGGTLVTLRENYRSTGALIDAYNTILDDAADPPFFTGAVGYDAPVACGRPSLAAVDASSASVTPVHVLRLALPRVTRRVAVATLGARIADEIRSIVDRRSLLFEGAPIRHPDVFVLTRTAVEGRLIGAELRAAGIPHAFYKEEGLFQTEEALDVLALLAAVSDPKVRSKRLAAWLTPFFDLTIEELERCKDLPGSHPLVATLFDWNELAEAERWGALFSSIVERSGILRRELFLRDGERQLTNYTHLFESLLEHAMRTRCSVRELVHALRGFVEETRMPHGEDGNVQRLESERSAVQIMTMHKAKGLEAAVVFVAGGFTRPPTESVKVLHEEGRRFAYVGAMSDALKPIARRESAEEDQRLMYVALTRAKARLYLPCFVGADGDAPTGLLGPYACVNERMLAIVDDGNQGAWFSVEDLAPGLRARADAVAECGRDLGPWRPPRENEHGLQDHAVLREGHAAAFVTSYTRIAAEGRGAPTARAVASQRVGALPAGLTSGALLHAVLEKIPLASFAGAPSFDAWAAREDVGLLFREEMRHHGIDPVHLAAAQRLVFDALTTPVDLPSGGRLDGFAFAERVVREMELVYPLPVPWHGYVTGVVDLAFEHAGRAYFIDWKSDSLASFDDATLARHIDASYAWQLKLYTLGVVKLLGLRTRAAYDARFGGAFYCFLRGMARDDGRTAGVHFRGPSWDDVVAWEAQLATNDEWGLGDEA